MKGCIIVLATILLFLILILIFAIICEISDNKNQQTELPQINHELTISPWDSEE